MGRNNVDHFAIANAGKLSVSEISILRSRVLLVLDADENEASACIFDHFALADAGKLPASDFTAVLNVADEANTADPAVVSSVAHLLRLMALALTRE